MTAGEKTLHIVRLLGAIFFAFLLTRFEFASEPENVPYLKRVSGVITNISCKEVRGKGSHALVKWNLSTTQTKFNVSLDSGACEKLNIEQYQKQFAQLYVHKVGRGNTVYEAKFGSDVLYSFKDGVSDRNLLVGCMFLFPIFLMYVATCRLYRIKGQLFRLDLERVPWIWNNFIPERIKGLSEMDKYDRLQKKLREDRKSKDR